MPGEDISSAGQRFDHLAAKLAAATAQSLPVKDRESPAKRSSSYRHRRIEPHSRSRSPAKPSDRLFVAPKSAYMHGGGERRLQDQAQIAYYRLQKKHYDPQKEEYAGGKASFTASWNER